jgi:hypothetical protein
MKSFRCRSLTTWANAVLSDPYRLVHQVKQFGS